MTTEQKPNEGDKMTTLRAQFEGDNGIIHIMAKRESESSENFNQRYVSKRNELSDARRVKLMGVSIMGDISHETVEF